MLTSRGIAIPLNELSSDNLIKLKKELTVKPEVDSKYVNCDIPSYKLFMMSKNNIYIPRRFKNVPNILSDGNIVQMEFDGLLKESTNQPEAANAVLEGLKRDGSGLLSLPTGYGKTTVALYVMCQLSVKTLIVVHKEFLMTQWMDRIRQFVPNAKIGKIQANSIDVEGKDVVVGMLQSLSMKDYDMSIFDGFGFTIIDETHHVCTRTFSRMLMKKTTKYTLGLSATLERKDGLTKVLHWFLGDVLYKIERKNQKHVNVKRIDYECSEYESFPINKARQPNMPEAINILATISSRNDLIVKLVRDNRLLSRKILVLTDRRQHCLDLLNMCIDMSPGLYIGGMKQDELKESEKCDVIIATYSLAHEGLDIPSLDTLILASPKSDIVQSVGRILRETKGKQNNPLVIDIVDLWGPFRYQYFKRLKYYKSTGFKIIQQQQQESEYLFHKDDEV